MRPLHLYQLRSDNFHQRLYGFLLKNDFQGLLHLWPGGSRGWDVSAASHMRNRQLSESNGIMFFYAIVVSHPVYVCILLRYRKLRKGFLLYQFFDRFSPNLLFAANPAADKQTGNSAYDNSERIAGCSHGYRDNTAKQGILVRNAFGWRYFVS